MATTTIRVRIPEDSGGLYNNITPSDIQRAVDARRAGNDVKIEAIGGRGGRNVLAADSLAPVRANKLFDYMISNRLPADVEGFGTAQIPSGAYIPARGFGEALMATGALGTILAPAGLMAMSQFAPSMGITTSGGGTVGAGGAGTAGFGSASVSPEFASSMMGTSAPVSGGGFIPAGYSSLPAGGMIGTGGVGAAEGAIGGVGATGAGAASAAGGAAGAGGSMGWIETLIGQAAGPAISGLLGGSSADAMTAAAQQAAATSAGAADRATALQRDIWQQQQANQAPWLQAGRNALAQMSAGTANDQAAYMRPFSMADYQADPGYAFRLSEGMKSLEQGAAARGGLLSGNMLRGAQEYGQGLASQEYQNAFNRYQTNQGNQFNRLASMAGIGQTANAALGQAGQQYAQSAGNIGMQSGANQANAALMSGQARASSLQGMGQALGGIDWGNVIGGVRSYF